MAVTQKVKKEVGASRAAKGILGSLDRRLVEPAGLLVRSSGWVLFVFILYMLWSGMFPEEARGSIYIWLGVYAGYLLLLEFLRRTWTCGYDTWFFRMTRISINLVVISSLISISATGRSLLIFAYTVPMFAAIIYFSDHNWVKVTVGAAAVLGLYLAGIPFARDTRLTPGHFVVLAAVLAVLGIGFELFRRKVDSGPARLTEIARELHKTLDLQRLIEDILKHAVKITQAQRGLIIVINPRNKRYVGHTLQNFALRANHSIEDLASKCLISAHKQPFENADLHGAFNNKDIYNEFFESVSGSVMAELLYDQAGQVIGVVTVASDEPNEFDKISKSQLREFGFLVSSAIDNCFRHREITLRDVRDPRGRRKVRLRQQRGRSHKNPGEGSAPANSACRGIDPAPLQRRQRGIIPGLLAHPGDHLKIFRLVSPQAGRQYAADAAGLRPCRACPGIARYDPGARRKPPSMVRKERQPA